MPARLLFLRPPLPPPDDSPKAQAAYNRAINQYHFKLMLCVFVFGLAGAWALSPIGFARAGNVEVRIEKALEPVKDQQNDLVQTISEIQQQQKITSKQIVTVLAKSIASEIRYLATKRCVEEDRIERNRLFTEIDLKQEEYKELKGERYMIPVCSEL